MKKSTIQAFILAAALFAACTTDEPKEVVSGGHPVEVSLSFALAEVDDPQVTVEAANPSEAASSPSKTASTSTPAQVEVLLQASEASSPLKVGYVTRHTTTPTGNVAHLRTGTSLSNVWVLQFDSTLTTGATTTAGACVAAKYIGTATTGDNLNPTLLTGTGQVIYVIANGPAAGTINTGTYTLSTFQSSAYFVGTITGDDNVPYIGRIEGGTTIEENGEVTASGAIPTITLYRIAAKISLNLSFNVTGYTLLSVKLYNKPTYMYYLNGASSSPFPTGSTTTITTLDGTTANVVPGTPASGTYVWYTGENKRGTNATVTDPYDKYSANAPDDYCSYIVITAANSVNTTKQYSYTLYLGENGTSDFNVKRNWDYTLDVSISGNESTQDAFVATDNRIAPVAANCYIVTPSTSISLPVGVKGNGGDVAGTGLSISNDLSTASLGVLWQTASGLVTAGTINTTTKMATITASATPGNAVIALYSGAGQTGTILWSWHIWVTDYNPFSSAANTTYTITNTASASYTFMDRNLGATNITVGDVGIKGLMYQWGRKDPFPGSTTIDGLIEPTLYGAKTVVTKTPVSASNNLGNSVLNPATFYYGINNANTGYDWYTNVNDRSSQNDALWGGASTSAPTDKTIFDPCPAGWRVAAWRGGASPWSAIGANGVATSNVGSFANFGVTWSVISAGFWPAAGYRINSSGALNYVGSNGYYWSASPNSSFGYTLRFGSIGVYPSNTNCRASGFSVRCVQE